MLAHYDDPGFSYVAYWQGRDYEHNSEILALKKLLPKSKYLTIGDIGGGYGRLTKVLSPYADKVYLIEPSKKQLSIAVKDLKKYSNVKFVQAGSEKTGLKNNFLDLAVMIRVSHHLPDILPTLDELYRVLKPSGSLIIEIANSNNWKSKFSSFIKGVPITTTAMEKRSQFNIRRKTIPYVNHHPSYIITQLARRNFHIDKIISVSNLRHPKLKKYLPFGLLLFLENLLQFIFSPLRFGPSIFILAHKQAI